ncbi:MAG: WD40 repeat domain-containing protein, partial [Limisphaerales bacterium]
MIADKPNSFPGGAFLWRSIIYASVMVPLIAAEEARPSLPVARPNRTDRVSFHREILPVLQANCLPCHNQTRAKADLILETPGTMLKGGESGPALVPGKPQESRVLQSAAHRLEDFVMPPAGNKVNARDLTPAELGLLSLWIEQGAEADAVQADKFNWQTIPTNWVSSFAVALMSDGESVAVARGNRVFLYDAKSGQPSGELADPALDGAAQRDWVSALAFSPDGELLAAAGFREVRLWQRRPVTIEPAWTAVRGTNWIAATFSSDRSRLAVISAEGGIEVRNVRDGTVLGSWRIDAAPPFRLALDRQWLAVTGSDGLLQVISLAGDENRIIQSLGSEPIGVAWFDQGRQLATVAAKQDFIRTWRLPTPVKSATNLEAAGDRHGHSSAIMALASEPGLGGSFVSADTEGIVRRWFPDPAATPQETRVEGSIVRLDFIGPGARFPAGLAAGGTTLVSFDEDSKDTRNFGGDPRLSKTLAALEDELALSRTELARAGTLISEA